MLAAPYYVPAQFSKGALPDGRATRAQQAERADVLSHDVQRMSPGGGDRSIRRRRVHPAQSGRRRRQAGVRRVLHANGRGVSGQARRVQAGDGGGPIRRAALLPGLARRWPVGGHGHLPLRRGWQNRRTLGRAPEDSRAGGQREHDVLADDPVAPVDRHGPPIRESHQRFAHPPRLTGDLEGFMRTNWMASAIVSLTMLVGAAQAAAQTDFQATTGLAVASTVNGSVNVTMGRADWPNGARFKTVNGGITLTLPSIFDAELRAEVLNGSITSDFPVTVTGQVSPRRLRGRIGNGGHELDL